MFLFSLFLKVNNPIAERLMGDDDDDGDDEDDDGDFVVNFMLWVFPAVVRGRGEMLGDDDGGVGFSSFIIVIHHLLFS